MTPFNEILFFCINYAWINNHFTTIKDLNMNIFYLLVYFCFITSSFYFYATISKNIKEIFLKKKTIDIFFSFDI